MRYMLDTNICIYLIQKRPPAVVERFRSLGVGDVVISAITLAELRHGVERNAAIRQAADSALRQLLTFIPVMPFEDNAAAAYGTLAAAVRDRRRDALDKLIAAHAVSLAVTLVTNNEDDFCDYPGLMIENWVATSE